MDTDENRDLSEVAGRLREAAAKLGGRTSAAKAAGVSVPQWDRYIAGKSQPPFVAVARFADVSGVSLFWLATGRGPMSPVNAAALPPPLDAALLAEIVGMMEGEAARRGLRPEPQKYAEMVAHLYAYALRLRPGTLGVDAVVALFDIAA